MENCVIANGLWLKLNPFSAPFWHLTLKVTRIVQLRLRQVDGSACALRKLGNFRFTPCLVSTLNAATPYSYSLMLYTHLGQVAVHSAPSNTWSLWRCESKSASCNMPYWRNNVRAESGCKFNTSYCVENPVYASLADRWKKKMWSIAVITSFGVGRRFIVINVGYNNC